MTLGWLISINSMHELFTCGVVVCLAAGCVDHPPAEAPGAEAEEVLVSVEVSDGEVVADDEHVEPDPDQAPHRVGHQVVGAVLVQTEDPEDDEDDVEEVGEDGQPHVAQEVEYLPLRRGDELEDVDDVEDVPGHAVLGPHLGWVRGHEAGDNNIRTAPRSGMRLRAGPQQF